MKPADLFAAYRDSGKNRGISLMLQKPEREAEERAAWQATLFRYFFAVLSTPEDPNIPAEVIVHDPAIARGRLRALEAWAAEVNTNPSGHGEAYDPGVYESPDGMNLVREFLLSQLLLEARVMLVNQGVRLEPREETV